MIRIAIIAPLLLATGMGANAEICIIPTDDVVQARTAKCLLSIDGMLLVDDRCNFRVSPDGHRTTLDAGQDYAEVNVTPRGAAIGFWNRGVGRRDRLTSLGLVTRVDSTGAYCYHNRRFDMCASDYLTCKCGPNELYGCMPAHAD
jgi:hypothetical protein